MVAWCWCLVYRTRRTASVWVQGMDRSGERLGRWNKSQKRALSAFTTTSMVTMHREPPKLGCPSGFYILCSRNPCSTFRTFPDAAVVHLPTRGLSLLRPVPYERLSCPVHRVSHHPDSTRPTRRGGYARRELSQLVAHHGLSDGHLVVDHAIVYLEGQPDKARQDRRGPRLGSNRRHPLAWLCAHDRQPVVQERVGLAFARITTRAGGDVRDNVRPCDGESVTELAGTVELSYLSTLSALTSTLLGALCLDVALGKSRYPGTDWNQRMPFFNCSKSRHVWGRRPGPDPR